MKQSKSYDVLLAIKNGNTMRESLVAMFPRATMDYHIGSLKEDGFITVETVDRKSNYKLTDKGYGYLRSVKCFDGVLIDKTPTEIINTFKQVITDQIIMEDSTLLDMFVTIPFCYGGVGRNPMALMPMILSAPGRGKTALVKIYQEVTENTKYIDCKDILTQGGIENRFKNAVNTNPDILVIDEFTQIYGSKLTALQSIIAEHIYPVVLLGNPATHVVRYNFKETPFTMWLANITKGEQNTSRSFLDRVNLYVYFPELKHKKENDARLLDILFDDGNDPTDIIGAYIKQQQNKSPKPTTEASKYYTDIMYAFDEYLKTNPKIDVKNKVLNLDGVPTEIHLQDIVGPDNVVRFKISIVMLARGMAIRDDCSSITPEYFKTSFSWYFYFLKQLYGVNVLNDVERYMCEISEKDDAHAKRKAEIEQRQIVKEKAEAKKKELDAKIADANKAAIESHNKLMATINEANAKLNGGV